MRGCTEEPKKICSKGFKKERYREGEQGNMGIFRISNIQAEEVALKDQHLTTSGVTENADEREYERKRYKKTVRRCLD